MKKYLLLALYSLSLTSCTFAENYVEQVMENKIKSLSIVKENHLIVDKDNEKYILDTYIELFKRPYYIHVRKENQSSIPKDVAVQLAQEYITTRGCTSSIERLPKLDVNTWANKQWLIALQC